MKKKERKKQKPAEAGQKNLPGENKIFNFKTFLAENKIILFFLAFLVIVSYVNSFNNSFVSDDIPTIAKNPEVGNSIGYIFSSPFGIIQRFLYHVAFQLSGLDPLYYRLPNILFHLGSTLLVFLILSLMAPRKVAIMAASLFAVHPMMVESVAWISGSPYSQSAFFFLLFFVLYILSKQNSKLYYFSLAIFLISLSAMPRVAVMFGVIFLYDFFFDNLKKSLKKLLPLFFICSAAAIFLLSQVSFRLDTLRDTFYMKQGTDSLLVKIPTSIAVYLKLLLWPDKLSLYQTELIFTTLQYYFSIFVFLAYIGAIIYFYKKNRLLSFWMIFFIIPLIPTLTPLRIAWAVAERYNYIGYLGFFVVVAYIFYKISEYKKLKLLTYIIFGLIIIALSIRTAVRNVDWKNDDSIWIATAKTSPSGSTIHNNLGNIYFEKGDYEKAIDEFKTAIRINSDYGDAYHNLANVYYQIGKLPEAAQNYQKTIELNPRMWQTHQNLAAIYFAQGQYDLAREEIKKSLEINPNDENAKANLNLIENTISSLDEFPSTPLEKN